MTFDEILKRYANPILHSEISECKNNVDPDFDALLQIHENLKNFLAIRKDVENYAHPEHLIGMNIDQLSENRGKLINDIDNELLDCPFEFSLDNNPQLGDTTYFASLWEAISLCEAVQDGYWKSIHRVNWFCKLNDTRRAIIVDSSCLTKESIEDTLQKITQIAFSLQGIFPYVKNSGKIPVVKLYTVVLCNFTEYIDLFIKNLNLEQEDD